MPLHHDHAPVDLLRESGPYTHHSTRKRNAAHESSPIFFSESGLTRRRLLYVLATAALGASMLDAAGPPSEPRTPARPDIDPLFIIHLSGGAPAKETFNPDPETTRSGQLIESSTRGPFSSIATKIPGVRFCEVFQKMAERNDEFALVRSLDAGSSDHTPAQANSVQSRGVTVNERIGDRSSNGAPPYVLLNPGSTWEGLRRAFRIGDAFAPIYEARTKRFQQPQISGDTSRLRERVDLLRGFEDTAPRIHSPGADRLERFREGAIDLSLGGGRFLKAYNLPNDERERYGNSDTGNHILLGKRMIEHGAGSVTYYDEREAVAWDTHNDTTKRIRELGTPLDTAVSALLDDMKNGLRCTLLITTEFNRGPDMNDGGGTGRPHWPEGNWAILAGPRIRAGAVVGRTNHRGRICEGGVPQREVLSNTLMLACGMALEPTRQRIGEVLTVR